MKHYLNLTKTGIIVFVLLAGVIGYALSFPVGRTIDFSNVILLMLGLYFLSAGSFAINQAQEWTADQKMQRTSDRPLVIGVIQPWQAYTIGILFSVFGLFILFALKPLAALLGFTTLVLYNGLYTLWWKKHWAFGAIPGAIPGAMPSVIGYSINNSDLFTPQNIYLFLVMFIWQMPHFWCLAIRFKEDYKQGGFPVLPVQLGVQKTLFQIGIWTFIYVAMALSAPWFIKTSFLYLLLCVPFALKVLWEFFKYFKEQKFWLSFFLWTNLSLLVFLAVPVLDKWLFYTLL